MKLKKIALALASILTFSSLAACGNTDQKIPFYDYWEKDALGSAKVVERLEYKVTHKKDAGLDALNYTITYGEGTYVTTLKANSQGYSYHTELTMDVTFQYGDEAPETVTDKVVTDVIFKRSSNALQPVSSHKEMESHTPRNSGVNATGDCYLYYNFTVDTTYPEEGKATTVITNNLQDDDNPIKAMESTFSASDKKYSYLDNEQLLLALRAIPSSVTSTSVKIYNPFIQSKQKIDIAFTAEVGDSFNFAFNGDTKDKNITYRPVTLSIDSKNPGGSQTAWIAKMTDAQNNTYGNVMLKLSVPLSYSMGYLVYDLVSVTR